MGIFTDRRPILGPAVGPGMTTAAPVITPVVVEPVVVEPRVTDREIAQRAKAAYRQGQVDERGRHRSHPMLGFVVAAMAIIGAVVVFFAVREGSFGRGGQAVDSNLAVAAEQAKPVARDAANEASAAVVTVGAKLRDTVTGDETPAPAPQD